MNAVLNYKDENLLNFDFEMTIDVSLDSNCGVFRRYHVGNNPVNIIDPEGLAGKGGKDTFWRAEKCTAREDWNYCLIKCAPKEVESCEVVWRFGPTVKNGEHTYAWTKLKPPVCKCKDDDCPRNPPPPPPNWLPFLLLFLPFFLLLPVGA